METTTYANTPTPPYYAVIFTNKRTEVEDGYGTTGDHMFELASQQPGYLGVESFREASGKGVTISYWRSLDDIKSWKAVEAHVAAQKKGRAVWYENYKLRIAKVERDYEFNSLT